MVITRSSAREVSALLPGPRVGHRRRARRGGRAAVGDRHAGGRRAAGAARRRATVPAARVGALAALEAIGDPRAADAALGVPRGRRRRPCAPRRRRCCAACSSRRGARRCSIGSRPSPSTRRGRRGAPGGARRAAPRARARARAHLGAAARRSEPGRARDRRRAAEGRPCGRRSKRSSRRRRARCPITPTRCGSGCGGGRGRAAPDAAQRSCSGCATASGRRPDAVRRGEWMTARAVGAPGAGRARQHGGAVRPAGDHRKRRAGAGRDARRARRRSGTGPASSRSRPPTPAWREQPARPARSRRPRRADWWREHLAVAFRAIAAREKLNERHAVTKRIRARWPHAAQALLGPAR